MTRAFLKNLVRPTYLKLTLIIIMAVFLVNVYNPLVGQMMEFKLYDLMFKIRGPRPPGPEVVIVTIDEPSLKALGRWPWSRRTITRLVDSLTQAGALTVGFDIIFAEKEEDAGVEMLAKLEKEISQQGWRLPGLEKWVKNQQRGTDSDGDLAKALTRQGSALLGYYFFGVEAKNLGERRDLEIAPDMIKGSAYNLVRWTTAAARAFPLPTAKGVEMNIERLAHAASDCGYFNIVPDHDGTIRWVPMAIRYQDGLYAPLSLALLRDYWGRPPLNITIGDTGVQELRMGNKRIPVDAYGRFWINYCGPVRSFPHYSVIDILEGRIPASAFQDRIVLVGATAVGIYDIRVTPFANVYPGVEVHANIIDNFLRNNFLMVSIGPWGWHLLALVLLGLVMGWSIPRLHAWASFSLFVELAFAYMALNYYLFSRWNYYYQMVYPLQGLLSVYLGVGLMRLLNVERDRKRIKSTFQSFVAPEVVNEMLRHPEKLRLGGEKRDLTVIFSDIRGFTTLAETMNPEDLVNLLHTYLTPMTDIVFKNGGTVDKYIGDAVMAIYGAPLELPQHADHACFTALDMVTTLRELCQQWTSRGWPCIQIGIGVNSGPMTVGNLGSERLFDYTVIGDHVNLASRLEGLNKYYGTNILLSGYTAALLQDPFILREVDKVKVKGKKAPVVIYELMGLGQPDDEQVSLLQTFAAGLAAFRGFRFPEAVEFFSSCLSLFPGDGPSRLLLERSREFMVSPPPDDWDGATAMTEK